MLNIWQIILHSISLLFLLQSKLNLFVLSFYVTPNNIQTIGTMSPELNIFIIVYEKSLSLCPTCPREEMQTKL